jgi:hypothetical protein
LRRAVGLVDPRRHDGDKRHRQQREPAARRPAIADQPPGLGDKRAARRRLDVDARARDQRRDDDVIVVVLDAEELLGVGERDRLGPGAGEKKR